ncbi:MAG: hypothetical protein M1812_005180 [Candelaria pacifica]|nr:MAG: hypothetical protein M1812_005180 [Candelaria pacifica]
MSTLITTTSVGGFDNVNSRYTIVVLTGTAYPLLQTHTTGYSVASSNTVVYEAGGSYTPATGASSTPSSTPSSGVYSTNTTSAPSTAGMASSTGSGASASQTAAPVAKSSSGSDNKGLIAAAGVLGGLLFLALLGIAFLLFRRRKPKPSARDSPEYAHLEAKHDSSHSALADQVRTLQASLSDREAQLKSSQAALLRSGRGGQSKLSSLSDREIHAQFSALSKAINDWVLTYFKNPRANISATPELSRLLSATQPSWQTMLGQSRTKYLVIRAVVAQVLTEGFSTGELMSAGPFSALESLISGHAPQSEVSQWRAQTLNLLSSNPTILADSAQATQVITRKIDSLTSPFSETPQDSNRTSHLHQIVQTASNLAFEVAKQRPQYTLKLERVGSTFSPNSMEDVLQDSKGDQLQGRAVKAVVFPAVTKWGDDEGENYERAVVVSKAQVLV